MILRGRIIADGVVTPARRAAIPSALRAVDRHPVTERMTNIWGHSDVDTSSSATQRQRRRHDPRQRRLHLPRLEDAASTATTRSSSTTSDGEDRLIVYHLQTMDVAAGHTLRSTARPRPTSTPSTRPAARQPAQLRHQRARHGRRDDGVDELAIYGTTTGRTTASRQHEAPRRHLPAPRARSPSRATGRRPTGPASSPCCTAIVEEHRFDGAGDVDTPNPNVQRINYDTALNGRLSVYGLGGNDSFFSDDNSVDHDARRRRRRRHLPDRPDLRAQARRRRGPHAPHDVFPVQIATTRGWLSPGTHAPLVAQGGTGEDQFTVYSNQHELRLEGDDGNDSFVVRASPGASSNGPATGSTATMTSATRGEAQSRTHRRSDWRTTHRPRRTTGWRSRSSAAASRRPAAGHPLRRRRGRGAVQRQRAGLGRRRHRHRQARRPRDRVRRRHRHHRRGHLRRRPQRPLRERRDRRGRRARGRRRVLRPVDARSASPTASSAAWAATRST